MPSRNTNYARKKGYSNIKLLESKGTKNYGQKTGQCLNTSALRANKGKAPWRGDEKARKAYEAKNQ